MSQKIEFENDRVRVLRVKHSPRERHATASRRDRLIIYLNDAHIIRSESAANKDEELHRKRGTVVWRNASEHQIANATDSDHEVVIVELKR